LKDPSKVSIFNNKKKIFVVIVGMVEDLGDPSDPEKGWDVVFTKVKNGPKVYNVEYTVQQLKCKNRALTETELAMLSNHPTIDEILRRAPAEDIKKYLDELRGGLTGNKAEGIDDEIPEDFTS
jgi:hypothetical protein